MSKMPTLGHAGSSKKHSGSRGNTPKKHHPSHSHNAHKGKHASPPAAGLTNHPGVGHSTGTAGRINVPLHPPGAPLVSKDVCLCTAQALVASLRLSGWPAGEDDALEFYFRLTDDPERGIHVEEALGEAMINGIAGVKPIEWSRSLFTNPGCVSVLSLPTGERHCVTSVRRGILSWNKFYPANLWTPDCVTEDIFAIRWPR